MESQEGGPWIGVGLLEGLAAMWEVGVFGKGGLP